MQPLLPSLVSVQDEWGVPGGVKEAVPRDAVSRCCWRNKPESRSATPINPPLEPIVAVSVGTTSREERETLGVLTRLFIIYWKYEIKLLGSNRIIHNRCIPTVNRGFLDWRKVFRCAAAAAQSIWDLMFYGSNKHKRHCASFSQTIITPWQSQRDPSDCFHRDRGNRSQRWEA